MAGVFDEKQGPDVNNAPNGELKYASEKSRKQLPCTEERRAARFTTNYYLSNVLTKELLLLTGSKLPRLLRTRSHIHCPAYLAVLVRYLPLFNCPRNATGAGAGAGPPPTPRSRV